MWLMAYTEADYKAMRIWLYEFINNKCIWRAENDAAKIPSRKAGEFFTWQFYLRRGLMDATFRDYVGHLFWRYFGDEYRNTPFQIVGPETGGTPLVSAIANVAEHYDIEPNTLALRKKRKVYGLFNQFEGIIDYSKPALVVDDLSNTGWTLSKANKLIADEGIKIAPFNFTLIARDSPKIAEFPAPATFSGTFSIFHVKDFYLSHQKYVERFGVVNLVPVEFERNREG